MAIGVEENHTAAKRASVIRIGKTNVAMSDLLVENARGNDGMPARLVAYLDGVPGGLIHPVPHRKTRL
jgi:hypothetical protein